MSTSKWIQPLIVSRTTGHECNLWLWVHLWIQYSCHHCEHKININACLILKLIKYVNKRTNLFSLQEPCLQNHKDRMIQMSEQVSCYLLPSNLTLSSFFFIFLDLHFADDDYRSCMHDFTAEKIQTSFSVYPSSLCGIRYITHVRKLCKLCFLYISLG